MKLTYTIFGACMALTLILTVNIFVAWVPPLPLPSKPARASRFLQQTNPRTGRECPKDMEPCNRTVGDGKNATCCRGRCVDIGYDFFNCGGCGLRCAFPRRCCRGECINNLTDARHCGACNNTCIKGQSCLFGMCGYAQGLRERGAGSLKFKY